MLRHLTAILMFSVLVGFQPVQVYAEDAKPVKTETKAETPKKAKRLMSEKQQKNVSVMRACGAEWRAAKAAGTVKGQKWRGYLKDCRVRKKAEDKA